MTAEEQGGPRLSRIFVSHSSEDARPAAALVGQLEEAGLRCWLAPRDVPPGSDYAEQISHAVESADAFLLLFSRHSRASGHCLRELELAINHNIRLYPFRLDDAPLSGGYEYRLATVQWLNDAAQLIPALLASFGDGANGTALPLAPKALPLREARKGQVPDVPALSGRELEIGKLRATLDAVVNERSGRLILIHGESGVGKSVLSESIAFEAQRRGFFTAATVCEPFHEGMSFFPVRELTRQLTRSGSPLSDMTALYGAGSLEASMAALAEVDDVDPAARRDAMLATLANMAIGRTLVDDQLPVMLLIDDLERTDAGTTDSLLCLLARLAEAPVVVVGTYRSDVVAASRENHALTPLLSAARRAGPRTLDLEITPMTRSQMRDVVECILGGPTNFSHPFLDKLWQETEGNPLYVREVLRSLQDERADYGARLANREGAWELVGDLVDWRTPASVEDAIRARLDSMDQSSRSELEKASVIGRRFAFSVMVRLSESEEDCLLDRLEECVSLSLIQETTGDEEEFEFTHGKIRDVLYQSMSRIRRRRLHSIVADALSALRGTVVEEWDGLIGEHLYQAGRFSECVPLLQSAAERMLRVLAAREAAGLLEKALIAQERSGGQLAETAALKLARINALVLANEHSAALDLAVATAGDPAAANATRGWALDFAGDIYRITGRRDQALSAYHEAEEIALKEEDATLELEVCADLAELCERASEQLAGVRDSEATSLMRMSDQYLDRQLALARECTDRGARARALRNEAKRLRRSGDVLGALQKYEEGLSLSDPRVATHSVLISYAKTLRFADRSLEAVRVVDRVLEWSIQSGSRRSLGIALHYRALLKFESEGPVDAVKSDLEEALQIHREIEYERGIWEVSTLMGEWCASRNDWSRAFELFAAVLGPDAGQEGEALVDGVCRQLSAIGESDRAVRLREHWQRRDV